MRMLCAIVTLWFTGLFVSADFAPEWLVMALIFFSSVTLLFGMLISLCFSKGREFWKSAWKASRDHAKEPLIDPDSEEGLRLERDYGGTSGF